MALTHTILVTLAEQPYTGYEIWKQFEEKVNCFWKATQQQIYRELGKMEGKNLVASEIIPQVGKPDKKCYSLTEAGKQELDAWMQLPSEPTVIREDLLVKVRAGYLYEPDLIIQELIHRRQIHQQTLDNYREKEALFLSQGEELSLFETCLYLTLKRGMRYEQQWLEWCNEAIAVFKQMQTK